MNKTFQATTKAQITSVKSVEGGLKIRGYANCTTKDRVGDVIPKSAWENPEALKNYMKNPIILAFHDHTQPIGKMTGYQVTDNGLEIEAFISSADKRVHQLVSEGVLATFSVGFAIKDAEYMRDEDVYLIKEVELHEVSVVSVPCNQDSTFQVAKSMDGAAFKQFEQAFTEKTNVDDLETKPTEPEVSQKDEAEAKLMILETKIDILTKLCAKILECVEDEEEVETNTPEGEMTMLSLEEQLAKHFPQFTKEPSGNI